MKISLFVAGALGSMLLASAALAEIDAPAIDATGSTPAATESAPMPSDAAAAGANATGSTPAATETAPMPGDAAAAPADKAKDEIKKDEEKSGNPDEKRPEAQG